MPNIKLPKTALEPRPNLPAGMYDVMLDGFKPGLSKGADGKAKTVNLQPQMKIINSAGTTTDGKPLNGQKVFDNLNVGFGPRLQDFVHCFGERMVEEGDTVDIPGQFVGPDDDPSKWVYHGPLTGKVGKLELVEIAATKPGAKPTDKVTTIKRYFCAVQGCDVNHMENLAR